MKRILNSLVAGSCNVFGLALLVLSATAGGSAVRAEDPSTLQNVVFDPIAKIVIGIEQRVADLETTVAAFARSFTSERIVAQQLCIADGSGAQTCITKAELDALLNGAVRGNHAAAIDQPAAHAGESGTSLPVVAAAMPPTVDQQVALQAEPVVPMPEFSVAVPAATESPTAAVGEFGAPRPTVAAAVPQAVDQPVADLREATKPMPEVSPAVLPTTEQPTAATGESSTLPAVATVTLPAVEPVIAAGTTRETDTPAEQPAKDEETAHTGSLTANPTAPVLNTVPVDEPPALDRLE
jgi:hypothetical protein